MSLDEDKVRFLEETFRFCLSEVISDRELMEQYRRLSGDQLGFTGARTPIEAMVDEACGRDKITDAEARRFFEFVRDSVWRPWLAMLEAEAKRTAPPPEPRE